MDEEGIVEVCEALGLNYGRSYPGSDTWGPHISVSCPLAPSTHNDRFDQNLSCSIQINEDGSSGARCFSGNCNFKGSLQRLIRLAVEIRCEKDERGFSKPPPQELEDLYKRVVAIEKVSLTARHDKALKQIKEMAEKRKAAIEDRDVLPESHFDSFAGTVPKYAIERGLSLATCRRWGLGYDQELKYLVFPVRRRDGNLVGMVGRSVVKGVKRRHHNYVGLDKARHLFGAQLLRVGSPVIVVEGCIDAAKVDQTLLGEACVVASLGEGFSKHHAKTIRDVSPPCVYIFTDGDAAGRAMAAKIAYALHGLVSMKIMECPWGPLRDDGSRCGVDPGDLPTEVIRHLFDNAQPIMGKKIRWTNPPPVFDASKYK